MVKRAVVAMLVLTSTMWGASALRAQNRFVAVAHDTIAVVPGLDVVTVRDTAQDVCYVLFTFEGDRSAAAPNAAASPAAAAAERDRRLQDLAAEFDRSQYNVYPAVPPPNVLKYVFEAQKAESDADRAFIEAEVARIEQSLARLAKLPRIAVGGPAPCGAKPAPDQTKTPQK